MLKKLHFIAIFIAVAAIMTFAQRQGGFQTSVSGRVIDAQSQTPMEYANVVIYKAEDSSMVTGAITDKEGKFKIEKIMPGAYYLEIGFIGYEREYIDFKINKQSLNPDIGTVELRPASYETDEVTVEGEKLPFEYKIDKKVINVDKELTSTGGNAVDALQSSPAVTVDIEGNVYLRGSSSFTVLIDGRPTILDPSDALEQIPLSSIESIELITNPSAKYDPEGTSGIINIILKKDALKGLAGMMELNGGSFMNHGVETSGSYVSGNWKFTLGANYNDRVFPGTRTNRTVTNTSGSDFTTMSAGDFEWGRSRYNISGGVEYNLSADDIISLKGRFGGREGGRDAETKYTLIDGAANTTTSYFSEGYHSRDNTFWSLDLAYDKYFGSKKHHLSLLVDYSYRDGLEDGKNEDIRVGQIIGGQTNTEDEQSTDLEIKLDYTLPLGEKTKFEAGYESEVDIEDGFSKSSFYDTVANAYLEDPKFTHTTDFKDNTFAGYTLFASAFGKLEYQAGFRAEYTDRRIFIEDLNQEYVFDKVDYFPSAHLSYSLGAGLQSMVSYTRRIDRPRGWYLEPYETWMDANNVRVGNPSLDPEYINSFEAGIMKHFDFMSLSFEAYHREVQNKVERVRSVYQNSNNVMLHTFANVGTSRSTGLEGMLNFNALKFWNMTFTGSVYNYQQDGTFDGRDYDDEMLTWSGRMSNRFTISQNIQLQLNGMYRGPQVTAQGESEGMFFTDAAIKYQFIKNKMSATLRVIDIFSTMEHEYTSSGTNFSNYALFERTSPVVMLTFSFKLNNYKEERGRGNGGMDGGMGEDEF